MLYNINYSSIKTIVVYTRFIPIGHNTEHIFNTTLLI